MYDRKGAFKKVINLLEPLRNHYSKRTRKKSLPLLLKAYQQTYDILKEAEIKDEIRVLENDPECRF